MYFPLRTNPQPSYPDEGTINNQPIGTPPTAHTHPVAQINDATTVGQNLVKAPNPGAIRFFRINVDNTISELDAADFRAAIGAGSSTLVLGTTAGTACEGNDPRLSDARTPTAHTQSIATISDATTVGQNLIKAGNPGAIRFLRINADNTISELTDSDFRTSIGSPAINDPTTGSAGSLKSTATTGLMSITGPVAGAIRVVTIPDTNFSVARKDAAETLTGQRTITSASAAQLWLTGYTVIGASSRSDSGALILGDTSSYQGIIDYSAAGNTILTIRNTYVGDAARINFDIGTVTKLYITRLSAVLTVSLTGPSFQGSHYSGDGTQGMTGTKTFYSASSSGGSVNVLNTVTIKDGLITAWTQT